MSEPQPEATIDPQELAHRKRCVNDFRRFQDNIPQHLSAILDANLAEQGRSALLEVLILAVQAGRLLQLEDDNAERARQILIKAERMVQDSKRPQPSKLLKSLLDVNGRELRAEQEGIQQPVDNKPSLLVAPGFALPTKH